MFLMRRLGHSSSVALRYLHVVEGRDREIAHVTPVGRR